MPSGTSASIGEHLLQLFGGQGRAAMAVEPLGERRRSAPRRASGPAAAAWPPKPIRPSEQAVIASYRSKPAIDRAEPWPSSSPRATTIGRAVVGLDQPAGDDADDARVPALAAQDDRAPVAEAALRRDHRVGLGDDRLLDLLPLACCSGRAPRRARGRRPASSVVSISTASIARSSRPAALIRGARPKPTVPVVSFFLPRQPQTSSRARSPTRRRRRRSRPGRAGRGSGSRRRAARRRRPSPAPPGRSTGRRKSRRWGEAFLPSPKLLQICQASLNATAAPQRSAQG